MLQLIWLIFALLFFLLAFYHWRESKKSLNEFHIPDIPYWTPPSGGIPINTGILDKDIKKAFKDFEDGFNTYIQKLNKSSAIQNKLQALGYLAACLTAVCSIFITTG